MLQTTLQLIIKAVKCLPKSSVGLGPYRLKNLFKKTTTWHLSLELIKLKSFIACNCDRSRLKNPYLMYNSRRKSGNSIKHDDLHARKWEFDFGRLNFDTDHDESSWPNQIEVTKGSDPTNAETCSTPETTREISPEMPTTDILCDGTETYPYTEPDAKMSSDQPNFYPTKPRSAKHDILRNPRPDCNDD